MQLTNPPIVVVAFNRPNSLQRVLGSLEKAYYPEDGVTLIISIDKANDNQNVLEVAQQFQWKFGEKKVRYQSKNLGLRKHVMSCASYCNDYGTIILLEDDLFVSPGFYNYASQALKFSLDKNYIGGVSLYNHRFNINASANFSPIEDGYDNWYFQYASSWGQAWTKEQWKKFSDWYSKNTVLKQTSLVPKNVTGWSDKSWLKYYIHYLVKTDKYFLYPKTSFSTNFSDAGTHMDQDSAKYQVPISYSNPKSYNFSEFGDSLSTYDVFYENNQLHRTLKLKKEMLCIDLYGVKSIHNLKQRYLLSTKIYDFKILSTFGRKMKPIDANIIHAIDGTGIYLYDTSVKVKNKNKFDFYGQMIYNLKYISRRNAKKLFVIMYFQRFIQFFRDNLRL